MEVVVDNVVKVYEYKDGPLIHAVHFSKNLAGAHRYITRMKFLGYYVILDRQEDGKTWSSIPFYIEPKPNGSVNK